ncbi:hypothetical protein HX045_04050 [Myroides odoratimimus]|uniref:Uncharacterized protein n=4 Tax=Myroides TaxID=76831 RepID=A0A0S7ECA8_9FLAO|nr:MULTISPECIES: DUF5683 domain-containing protein [Myroides]AJA69145.1 hypothetical protein MYRA21_2011 [Myroides sp. A21]AJH14000.1 hypothetical protein MPR_0807 [Myroides profundi]ALU26380.1 hypothetical protein AS202_09575 [Myroides odoratimimus]APA92433.1 hypothetical protein BK054_09440 [Myroides sp. ZB35]EHO12138.1 hypothetical protein HMPREF9712_00385 [Myroides odoratimimus CCUG 10230]
MKHKLLILLFFIGAVCHPTYAQSVSEEDEPTTKKESADYKPLDPVAPSRAAFYASVIPGVGQIYNKKYWKVPLVYAGIGIPTYFWMDNQRQYNRYRDEYKKRLQGVNDPNDPTFGGLDNDRILEAQKFYRRNRDLSVVITVGFYVLSIIDANVDAHLMQFNVNENLTIKPAFEIDRMNLQNQNQFQYAINVEYRF